MAEVTEMSSVSPTIPPGNGTAPPKRRVGRPRKEEKAAEADIEPPDAEISGDEDFWLQISNYSLDEWNHLTAYLYRVAPRIDRKSNGKPINLGAYSIPFTREDIMKEHGSGVYRIDLCALEPAGSKSHRIAREVFTIINPKFPPVVPVGDWVDDRINDMWKWGIPGAQTQMNGNYPPGFDMDKMYNKAFEFAEKLAPKPTDNTGQNELLIKLIDVATKQPTPPPPPPPPDTSGIDRLLNMLLEDRKADRERLDRMQERLNAPVAPQKSIIEQFIEIRPQIKELVDAFATKTGKTDIWAELAKEGIGQIPDLIELGRDFVKRGDKPAAPAFQPRPQIAAPPTAATSNTQPAAPADMPIKSVEQMTEDEKRQYVDHLWNKYGPHLLGISSKLVEEYKVQDQGYSFRDWYCEMYGKLRWADLKRDLPPELITNMYHAHPQLREELAPPARLTLFLVQFFTPFGEEGDDLPPAADLSEDAPPHVEHTNGVSAVLQPEAKTKATPKGAH